MQQTDHRDLEDTMNSLLRELPQDRALAWLQRALRRAKDGVFWQALADSAHLVIDVDAEDADPRKGSQSPLPAEPKAETRASPVKARKSKSTTLVVNNGEAEVKRTNAVGKKTSKSKSKSKVRNDEPVEDEDPFADVREADEDVPFVKRREMQVAIHKAVKKDKSQYDKSRYEAKSANIPTRRGPEGANREAQRKQNELKGRLIKRAQKNGTTYEQEWELHQEAQNKARARAGEPIEVMDRDPMEDDGLFQSEAERRAGRIRAWIPNTFEFQDRVAAARPAGPTSRTPSRTPRPTRRVHLDEEDFGDDEDFGLGGFQ